MTSDQLGLFAAGDQASHHQLPAPPPRRRPGGSASHAEQALADIDHGHYGLIDATDRVVWIDGDEQHVRHSRHEDVITSLIDQGYAAPTGRRERLFCQHGAIKRPITPLRLTPKGKTLYHRWSALHGARRTR